MNRSRARTKRLLEGYNDLLNEYNKLVRRWNRYVKSLATGPAIGRLPRASQAQQAQVRMLRGAGKTVRQIAHETKLSFQTIRTIIGRKDALDRTTKRKHHLEKIKLKSPPHSLFTRPYADRGRAPRPNQRSDPGGRTPA